MQLGTQRVWDYIGGEYSVLFNGGHCITFLSLSPRQLCAQAGPEQGGWEAGRSGWAGWHGGLPVSFPDWYLIPRLVPHSQTVWE